MSHRFNKDDNNLDFEIMTSHYYPNLYRDIDPCFSNRVMVLHRSKKDYLPSYIGEYCKEASPYVHEITYGTETGYYTRLVSEKVAEDFFKLYNKEEQLTEPERETLYGYFKDGGDYTYYA